MTKSHTKNICAVLVVGMAMSCAQATTCSDFGSDMETAQKNQEQAEINQAIAAYDRIRSAADEVRKACMDKIAGIDTTGTGISSAIARALMQQAVNVCNAAANQVSSAQNQAVGTARGAVTQAVRSATGGGGYISDAANNAANEAINTSMNNASPGLGPTGPGSTAYGSGAKQSLWDSMTNWLSGK